MKLDLHLHTTFSDGRQTPAELAAALAEAKVTHAIVTDHDTTASYAEVRAACAEHGIKTVPGAEISSSYRGKPIHILAYGINPTSAQLRKFLESVNHFRRTRFLELLPDVNAALTADGKPPLPHDKLARKTTNYFSKPGIARILVEEGIVDNMEEGFGYSNRLKHTVPDVKPAEAIAQVHAAGGLAVLAHPLAPRLSLREAAPVGEWEGMMAAWHDAGLNGLEVYTPAHGPADTAGALQLAARYGLLVTGGSDWHGPPGTVGPGIREFIPHYQDRPGASIPEAAARRLAAAVGL
jgi:3',5'-nucleoside bisphosphate phosphatase